MKKIVVMSCVIMSVLLLCMGASFAGTITNWELVYEHDQAGNATKGTLADLVSAIRGGAEVQIVAHGTDADVLIRSPHIRIEGNGSLVVANLADNVANTGKTDVFLRVMIFRTNGQREIITQPGIGSTYSNYMPMSWYVNR